MNKTKLMLLGTVLAIIFFALLPGSFFQTAKATVRVVADPGTQATASSVRPTKRAVLIGINDYAQKDRISSLAGSLNDVADMRQVLIGKFEFLPENILVLEGSQATHAGIMSAIQNHLIAKSLPGDIVVFHFSGHGSSVNDKTGKMISGLDETIVPYDSRDPEGKVFDITGAELHLALVQLAGKTKNVTFILDSCHSGTLVRGARVRFIPADTRDIPASEAATTRGLAVSDHGTSPKFAYISAATSKENAFEHFAEGKDHGALTYFLTRQLRSAGPGATYRDVMDGVIGNLTANYPGQHPSLEGVEADQHVFGDGTSLAGTYAPASPSQLNPQRATLSVGQVQGATVGSAYDVYAPGSRKFALPERPTARVQLASVDAFSSEATILAGGKVAPASRAIEREHRYGSSRTRVYLEDVDKWPALQLIQDALASTRYIEIVKQPTSCNIQLRQVGQRIQTLAADSSTLSTPVLVSDPSATKRVLGQLQQWAKWFNVLSIRNSQALIDVNLSIRGSQTRDPVGRVGRPDMGIIEGETITATLANNSERDLYVAMLDLSGDGSISVEYPSQSGAAEVLKSHHDLAQSFPTFVPEGRSSVIDVLKVFVSYKPIDLTPLTQGSIRGLEGTGDLDPLQELLIDSAGASRGLGPLLTKAVDLGTWTTVQRVLLVKRKR